MLQQGHQILEETSDHGEPSFVQAHVNFYAEKRIGSEVLHVAK